MTTKTDAELADLLYGATVHAGSVLNDPTINLLQDLDQVNDANDSWRSALRAVEVSQPEGAQLTQLVQRYTAKPADDSEKAAWLKESSESLARVHGPESGRERAALAKQFAERSPVLAKTLAKAGLSAHPVIVEMLASRAWSARAQGRI